MNNRYNIILKIADLKIKTLEEYQSYDLEFYGKYKFDQFISDTISTANQVVDSSTSYLDTEGNKYDLLFEKLQTYLADHPEIQ